MAAKCNPQSQQIKNYAGGGEVRRGGPARQDSADIRRDPVPGTKGPNAFRPRGATGGGLNSIPASPTPPTSSAPGRLNPRTLDMEPRRNLAPDAYKKGGIVTNKAKSPSPFPFKTAAKTAKPGAKPAAKTAKPGGNPFAAAGKGPVRKKFI